MMSPAKLLDRLVHGNGNAAEDVPSETLGALEWSDADSGRDLVEKANGIGSG